MRWLTRALSAQSGSSLSSDQRRPYPVGACVVDVQVWVLLLWPGSWMLRCLKPAGWLRASSEASLVWCNGSRWVLNVACFWLLLPRAPDSFSSATSASNCAPKGTINAHCSSFSRYHYVLHVRLIPGFDGSSAPNSTESAPACVSLLLWNHCVLFYRMS